MAIDEYPLLGVFVSARRGEFSTFYKHIRGPLQQFLSSDLVGEKSSREVKFPQKQIPPFYLSNKLCLTVLGRSDGGGSGHGLNPLQNFSQKRFKPTLPQLQSAINSVALEQEESVAEVKLNWFIFSC